VSDDQIQSSNIIVGKNFIMNIWGNRSLDKLELYIDPNYKAYQSIGLYTQAENLDFSPGVDKLKERLEIYFSPTDKYNVKIIDIMANKDSVMAFCEFNFIHNRKFKGIKPTYIEINIHVFFWMKFNSGKIVNSIHLQDYYKIVRDIGLTKPERVDYLEYIESVLDIGSGKQ